MASEVTEAGVSMFKGSLESLAGLWWIGLIIFGLIFVGVMFWVWKKLKTKDKLWNMTLRVRLEDTRNGTIYLKPIVIKMRRLTLKNGVKMNLLEKPLLGKRLMPLLNYYTEPGMYDLVITSDNCIFLVTGIEGIDKQRKLLKVGVRYPGIDQDLDEINSDYKDLNAQLKKNSFLDILRAVSIGIFAICCVIIIIVGGKYWLEGKQADTAINQAQVEIFDTLATTSRNNVAYANALNLLVPKLEEMYGTRNLINQITVPTPVTNNSVVI